jgi:hypothetical protein
VATWPDDIIHVSFGCSDFGTPAEFGFWLHAEDAATLTVEDFQLALYDWTIFHQPTFLDCMATTASFITCRFERHGPVPLLLEDPIADNAGAQAGSELVGICCGLYLQSAFPTRGSGSRLHLPGLPSRFTVDGSKLSGYGWQELIFASDALAAYPQRLTTDWGRPTQLVTLQTRRAGHPLAFAQYTPTALVRPMRRLARCGRRLAASGGLSPP